MRTGDQNNQDNRGFRLCAEDRTLRLRPEVTRELSLRRRRSRIPWMFLVYQVRKSALPSQKCGDVQRRAEVEVPGVVT